MPYNTLTDFYWIVGGSPTQVYSSAKNTYVPISDADYQYFLSIPGNNPSRIENEVALWGVLKNAIPFKMPDYLFDGTTFVQPTPDTFSKKQLTSYAAMKRWEKEVGGITVNSIPVATDDRSKQMIMGARVAAEADPTFKTNWVGADGTVAVLTAPQIIAISDAVLDHVNNVFTDFSKVKKDIDDGKVVKKDKVDEVLKK